MSTNPINTSQMTKDFKSFLFLWILHHASWKGEHATEISSNLLDAYNFAQQAEDAISSSGLDGINRIYLPISAFMINDLEDDRDKLQRFCEKIHNDANDLIDNIFHYGVMKVLTDIYDLNPSNVTAGSPTENINLKSMMKTIILDEALKLSFSEKSKNLDQDVLTDDLKNDVVNAISRYYDGETTNYLKNSPGYDTITFNEDMELLIEYYEYLNPADGKNMDKLFKGMKKSGNYDQDIKNIKFIAYTAKEPYRSVFFKYLPDMHIEDYDYTSTQQYDYGSNELFLDFTGTDVGINDPRNPYVTFFHECGHAIDDLAVTDGLFKDKFYTWTYSKNDVTFRDVITTDVNNFLSQVAEKYIRNSSYYKGASDKEIKNATEKVVNQIMRAGNNFSSLPNELQSVYTDVRNAVGYCKVDISNSSDSKYKYTYQSGNAYNLSGPINEAFSDILGGMTDNTVTGSIGHKKASKDLTDSDYNNGYADNHYYWYDEKGNITGKQEKEAFAEIFSYNMTKSVEQQDSVDNYLPNTVYYFDKMMGDLANE